MTDANKESWYWDGKNRDLMIEDLLAVCVADEEAGAADEDTLDAAPREDFLLTMFTTLQPGTRKYSDDHEVAKALSGRLTPSLNFLSGKF